jgi:hypothetical protein
VLLLWTAVAIPLTSKARIAPSPVRAVPIQSAVQVPGWMVLAEAEEVCRVRPSNAVVCWVKARAVTAHGIHSERWHSSLSRRGPAMEPDNLRRTWSEIRANLAVSARLAVAGKKVQFRANGFSGPGQSAGSPSNSPVLVVAGMVASDPSFRGSTAATTPPPSQRTG